MTEHPLVTVVIPTYGRNDALHNTIDCIRSQTYLNWEVIVVDDNPRESEQRNKNQAFFAGLAEEHRIRYVAHADNLGACAARNTGVENASGDIIAFYDDDDVWFANKLERQLDFMREHELDFTFCWMNELYNGYRKVIEFRGEPDLYSALLRKGDGICTSAIMVKRAVALQSPFDVSLQSFQDFDYLLALAKSFKGQVQTEILMDYQISLQGISRNPSKKVQGLQFIIDKYGAEYESINFPAGLAELHQKQADFKLLLDHRWAALRGYFKAIKIAPGALKSWIKLIAAAITGKYVLTRVISRKQALQWQKASEKSASN